MFDIHAILWLTLIAIIAFYWHLALRAKEHAFIAAKRHCLAMEVQLLDETVYLRRIWFKRNTKGVLSLWRAFYFEFTVTGEDRYFGRVVMLGSGITEMQLEPHRLH